MASKKNTNTVWASPKKKTTIGNGVYTKKRPWLEIPAPNYIPLEEPEKQLNPDKWKTWKDPDQDDERVIIIQL